jgi:peptide/nickel transport system substrate-binding protein
LVAIVLTQKSLLLDSQTKNDMRYPRKTILLFAMPLAGFLLLSSCKQNKNDSDSEEIGISDAERYISIPDADSLLPGWKTDNTVVNHWVGPPDNLHPTNGRLAGRSWVLSLTHNYLMRLDPVSMQIVPDLAEADPVISANGLEFTYTVRKDARWDNGSPVTAEDVLFTLKMNKCPLTNNPATKLLVENLADIKTNPGKPNTLTLVMLEPYVQNIAFLSSLVIMQRSYHDPNNVMGAVDIKSFADTTWAAKAPEAVVTFMNEFNDGKYGNDVTLLNGSGAYKVTSWERGTTLVLEKKKGHWSEKIKEPRMFETAFADKIIFKEIKDDNAQILELKAQEIDATVWLSTQSMVTLEGDEAFKQNYNYRYTDNFNFNYIGVNMQPDGIRNKKLFNDKSVRQAMTYLVPIDDILQVIYNGKAAIWPSFLSPYKAGFNDTLKPYHQDVSKAMQMLDAAGWKDSDGDNIRDKMIDGKKVSFEFELLYASSGAWIDQMAEMIVEAFYPAGIKVNLVPMDLPALSQQVSTHDFDAYMGAWGTNSLPDDLSQLWHTSSYVNQGANFCGFGNSETDALVDSLNKTLDDELRAPMLQKLQAVIHDEAPYLMYISPSRKNVIHKRFGNQVMTFERPGNMLNHLLLLSGQGMKEME